MPGEGSVFRRASDGAWLAQISRGPRGERKTWSRSASTKSEALRKLVALRTDLDTPPPVKPTETVGAFLEQWVSDARNIRPNTRRGYAMIVRHHLVPTIGHIPLRGLTSEHVEKMLVVLTPTMSEKYLRNVHAALRRALKLAVRQQKIPVNVASSEFVDTPRVTLRDPEALTEAQLDALLAAVAREPHDALTVVLADCGLRMGEALGLTWGDIRDGDVHVELELTRKAGEYVRDDPKTERSRRTVPLTPRAEQAITAHRERLMKAGKVPISTGPIFVNRKGEYLSGSTVTHWFYRMCERAGLDRRPPKILRATFSSRLHAAGVSDIVIADLMGHTKTRTTKRHYIVTTPDQARDAVRRLAS